MVEDTVSFGDGAWIFVSHSHRDLAKVREVRNELERRGHNPLLFFLKCLDDNDAALPELLKREIKARQWFILCDSPSAQSSKWVQEEVAIIKSLEGKVFEVVDLAEPLALQVDKIESLSKRAAVFMSYSRRDQSVASDVTAFLRQAGYGILGDVAPPLGSNWVAALKDSIDDATRRGFVVVLLSENYLNSSFVTEVELPYIAECPKRRNVRCVRISPINIEDHPALASIGDRLFDLVTGEFDTVMNALVESMKTSQMD